MSFATGFVETAPCVAFSPEDQLLLHPVTIETRIAVKSTGATIFLMENDTKHFSFMVSSNSSKLIQKRVKCFQFINPVRAVLYALHLPAAIRTEPCGLCLHGLTARALVSVRAEEVAVFNPIRCVHCKLSSRDVVLSVA